MGTVAAGVGAAASLASAGNSIFGGGSSPYSGTQGGSGTNFYIPNNLAGQDANFQNMQSYITGQSPWGTLGPEFSSLAQQGYNDPYASGYQNSSNLAGATSGQYVNAMNTGANMDYGSGTSMTQAGNFGLGYAPGLLSAAVSNPYSTQAIQGADMAGQQLSGVGLGAVGQAGAIGGANMGALPGLQGYLQTAMSNPYGGQVVGSAGTGGGMVQGQAMSDYGNAQSMSGAGNSVLNTAFDPQNALYNQQFQQNTDQTRAGLEARGLDTSAAGQGIENNSNQNFNIAWQNAQLGRQSQGITSAAAADQSASALGTNAGTNYAQGGAMPFQAYTGVNDATGSALQNYLGGMSTLAGNATNANNLGAAGAQQMAAGSAMPYNQQSQYYNNLISNYGSIGQGAQSYGNLSTAGGNMYGQAGQLGNQAVGFAQNTGALPYNASQTIMGNQGTALTNYQGAYNAGMTPYQQSLMNSQAYMGLGNNAQNSYATAQNNAWKQNNTNMQNVGSGLTGLANSGQSLYNSYMAPTSQPYMTYGGGINYSQPNGGQSSGGTFDMSYTGG